MIMQNSASKTNSSYVFNAEMILSTDCQKWLIVAIFYTFSQFCEINISLLSLQTQPKTAPDLFQRGVEYGKYVSTDCPKWLLAGAAAHVTGYNCTDCQKCITIALHSSKYALHSSKYVLQLHRLPKMVVARGSSAREARRPRAATATRPKQCVCIHICVYIYIYVCIYIYIYIYVYYVCIYIERERERERAIHMGIGRASLAVDGLRRNPTTIC